MAFDTIKYINGSTYEFLPEKTPISQINGLGLQSNSITLSAPSQEGETYVDRIVSPRTITLNFTLLSKTSELEADKREVATVMNPRKDMGTLKIVRNGTTYCIDCKCETLAQPGGRGKGHDFQTYLATLRAPDPYFYLSTPTTVGLTAFSSGFEFDMEFDISFGYMSSGVTINNQGNVPTPVEITFTGGINRPSLINNDEEIKIEKDITGDEEMYINTKFGEKKVLLRTTGSTENAFEYTSTGSVLWYLSTGSNFIDYKNSGEFGNFEAKIVYYTRYNTI